MTLIGDDGKIKLDRLEGPEKRELVDAFLKSDPLHLLWFTARSSRSDGADVEEIMNGVQEHPSFTLYFKLIEDELLETTLTRESWIDQLRQELQRYGEYEEE